MHTKNTCALIFIILYYHIESGNTGHCTVISISEFYVVPARLQPYQGFKVLRYLVLEQGRPQKWTKEQNLNPLSQHRLALKSSFLTFHFSFSRDLYLTHLPSTPQLQFGIGSFHSAEIEHQTNQPRAHRLPKPTQIPLLC